MLCPRKGWVRCSCYARAPPVASATARRRHDPSARWSQAGDACLPQVVSGASSPDTGSVLMARRASRGRCPFTAAAAGFHDSRRLGHVHTQSGATAPRRLRFARARRAQWPVEVASVHVPPVIQWQRDDERAALDGRRLDGDLPSVHARQLAGDVEADASSGNVAGRRRDHPTEAAEQQSSIGLRNADALVTHGDARRVTLPKESVRSWRIQRNPITPPSTSRAARQWMPTGWAPEPVSVGRRPHSANRWPQRGTESPDRPRGVVGRWR